MRLPRTVWWLFSVPLCLLVFEVLAPTTLRASFIHLTIAPEKKFDLVKLESGSEQGNLLCKRKRGRECYRDTCQITLSPSSVQTQAAQWIYNDDCSRWQQGGDNCSKTKERGLLGIQDAMQMGKQESSQVKKRNDYWPESLKVYKNALGGRKLNPLGRTRDLGDPEPGGKATPAVCCVRILRWGRRWIWWPVGPWGLGTLPGLGS